MAADGAQRGVTAPPVGQVARISLDTTLLQILAFGADPRAFPFIEPPSAPALAAALTSLHEQGALRGRHQVRKTPSWPRR